MTSVRRDLQWLMSCGAWRRVDNAGDQQIGSAPADLKWDVNMPPIAGPCRCPIRIPSRRSPANPSAGLGCQRPHGRRFGVTVGPDMTPAGIPPHPLVRPFGLRAGREGRHALDRRRCKRHRGHRTAAGVVTEVRGLAARRGVSVPSPRESVRSIPFSDFDGNSGSRCFL